MKPDAALLRCPKCAGWVVSVAGKPLCECVIAQVHQHHRERLRRILSLLRETRAMCDRCDVNTAYRLVQCYDDCYHAQCWGCADQTKQERTDELEYARSLR